MLAPVEFQEIHMVREQRKAELIKEAVQSHGCSWFTVTSSSMNPTLAPGDQVLVKALPSNKCRVGDIVVFAKEAHFIVHRIIKKKFVDGNLLYWQKGDASDYIETVSESKVIGKVAAIKRGGATVYLDTAGSCQINYFRAWWFRISSLTRDLRSYMARNTAVTTPASLPTKLAGAPFLLGRLLGQQTLEILKNQRRCRPVLRALARGKFYVTPARADDLPDIIKLLDLEKAIRPDLTSPHLLILVARTAEAVVGCAILENLEPEGENWWVNAIRVSKGSRSLGIGADLIGVAESHLAARGVANLKLWVKEANYQALNLYKKLGYRVAMPNPLQTGTDILVLEKPVQGSSRA